MATPARVPAPPSASATPDLEALAAVSAAVEAGAGLPEVVRAASRALGASLVLLDPAGATLAVAARSPADERSLREAPADDVEVHELVLGEDVVARLRLRTREAPAPVALALVRPLLAAEAARVRAPKVASAEAAGAFLGGLVRRELRGPEVTERAAELGLAPGEPASLLVVRAHVRTPSAAEDWRARVLAAVERAVRAVAPAAFAGATGPRDEPVAEVAALVPGDDEARARRAAETVLQELDLALQGFAFAVGRSRVAADPADLPRAAGEALLSANVVDGDADRRALAFDETGSYKLLLAHVTDDPEELQRFYDETVAPVVAYDAQYETDLLGTLETFLDADANVAGTAQRLFTHRHTVRYRLDRVRDLTGLDVGSSDGRERLSLGLKAMRVLGIAAPRGPADEHGASAGRVPRAGGERPPR